LKRNENPNQNGLIACGEVSFLQTTRDCSLSAFLRLNRVRNFWSGWRIICCQEPVKQIFPHRFFRTADLCLGLPSIGLRVLCDQSRPPFLSYSAHCSRWCCRAYDRVPAPEMTSQTGRIRQWAVISSSEASGMWASPSRKRWPKWRAHE
jgi:hypothetical protein